MHVATHALFPTSLHQFVNPTAETDNATWRAAIRALREQDTGRTISNVRGWQSSRPLQTVPELTGLARFILQCLEKVADDEGWAMDRTALMMEGWANINGPGAMNNLHNHPNCLLSGTYYIDTPPAAGNIVFRDPRESAHIFQPPYRPERQRPPVQAVTPVPGMLIVFPSWLLHAVEPNASGEERMSVAFNAIAVPKG